MATHKTFEPLNDTEFRLLRIHQGSGKDILTCSLEIHNVETGNHSYTAISYAWGPPEDPYFDCNIDSVLFKVRQNAYNILRRLQKVDKDIFVWLDALCINQKDKPEKSAQIRIMYRIYHQAKHTAIWLGEADDLTELVFRYVNTFKLDKIMDVYNSSRKFPDRPKLFILDELASHPEKVKLVNGIGRLFHAVWFSRVWIRQEGSIGGDPYALKGSYSFTWTQLTALAYLYRPRVTIAFPDWVEIHYAEIEPALVTIGAINSYRDQILDRVKSNEIFVTTLHYHLVEARSSQTEKPHDKVYALISMVTSPSEASKDKLLTIDYHLAWQEVYVKAARFCFTEYQQSVEVLAYAGLVYQGVNSDLPSWVPDWRHPDWTQFVVLPEWCAGGDTTHIRTTVRELSKQDRQRLVMHRGVCSIVPLCASLSEDRERLKRYKFLLEESKSQGLSVEVQAERLRRQEEWLRLRQSASRAALVLEILICMQDEITYVSPKTSWYYDNELHEYKEQIISCDAQNLRFLESLSRDFYITSESLRHAYNATIISSQNSEDKAASEEFISSAEGWREWLKNGNLTREHRYHSSIENSQIFRAHSFAWTASGYMALLPSCAKLGDQVVVFAGYRTPFVIRPVQEWYMLIGMCYIHGMMMSWTSTLIEEFDIKFEDGKSHIRRPQGDIRTNGKKLPVGHYVDILQTLGNRKVKLI